MSTPRIQTVRERRLQYGTEEFLVVLVTADVELTDADPVTFTFDRDTFHDGDWADPAASKIVDERTGDDVWQRRARVFIGGDAGVDLTKGRWPTWVRVTDDPEAPLLLVGHTVVE